MTFVVTDPWNMTSTVLITPATRLLSNGDFDRGDVVVIFGDEDNRVIRAQGIQEIRD